MNKYNQETDNDDTSGRRAAPGFPERDPIAWKASPCTAFYKKLLALKKQNTALWNGEYGAKMVQVPNNAP